MSTAVPPSITVSGRHIEVEGARLWCWDTGGTGEPVILCHPASQSSDVWGYQQQAFTAHGYRLIAYSRRGYGNSEKGSEGDAGTSVGDLAALLDTLILRRAHIIGAAAGGITALAFAIAHPERTLTVTLAGTIFAPDEDDWRDFYGRLNIEAVRKHVPVEFIELGPSYRASNPAGTEKFVELSAAAHRNAPQRQPSGVKVTWDAMSQMARPALLLTGEADLFAPPPLQDMVAAHLPNAEIVTMPKVGHAAYWEAPNAFNTIVLNFLARTPAEEKS